MVARWREETLMKIMILSRSGHEGSDNVAARLNELPRALVIILKDTLLSARYDPPTNQRYVSSLSFSSFFSQLNSIFPA